MAFLRRESVERPISPEAAMLRGVTEKGTEDILAALFRSLGIDVLDEEDSRRAMAQQANVAPAMPQYEARQVAVPQSGLAEVAPGAFDFAVEPAPSVAPLPGFSGNVDNFTDVTPPFDWDEMARDQDRDRFDLAA
ncbi:MAG TPA: hypothetical protein VLA92_01220 [Candidatus Saccharimonadales bacterium]|nr:hypothetical protein [Candidatus Saccharimonadales bacterium]